MQSLARFGFTIGAAALLTACGGAQPPIGATTMRSDTADALPYHKTFHYTGSSQSFIVPAHVTQIDVDARGAGGGGKSGNHHGYYEYFGRGGRVKALIPVTPSETLYIFVGGQGSTSGGFNGGGNPGSDPSRKAECFGGGGASDVRENGQSLSDRVLVAAGGGAQGCVFSGYDGRYLFGGKGGRGVGQNGGSHYGAGGGFGGTQSGGGAGGSGGGSASGSGFDGESGSSGNGGNGGAGGLDPNCNPSNYLCQGGGGGGGGGGYYGGGGGGGGGGFSDYALPGAGGGGGSSYVEVIAPKTHLWRGWKTANGDGIVVFSWK